MKRKPLWWRRMMAALVPRRALNVVEGDTLPTKLPRWNLSVDACGHVCLHPSVWLREGCKSHFWVRSGKIVWCD